MKMTMRVAALAAFGFYGAAAGAQEAPYPTRPIRMIVPWSAGSQTDLLARMIQPRLAEALGQTIVVDNRAGAGGTVGAALVAIAPPDGHTFMVQAAAHAVSPALYAKLPYDTVKDFAGISRVGSVPNVLVVAPSLGVRSARDLIALAKQKPGQINFTSAGVGGGTHINGEQFKAAAGINVVHVPNRGTPEALVDVTAGRIHYFFAPLGSALPFLKEGKLIGLAVSTVDRSPILPDVPTVAEAAALPGFDFDLWYAMFAPARTPRHVVQRLSAEVRKIIDSQDIRQRMAAQGVVARSSTPEDLDKFLRLEVDRLGKVVRDSGAKVN